MLNIGVMNGDDIGLEIVPATVATMQTAAGATDVAIEWTNLPIGRRAFDELGTTMTDDTLERLSRLDGWVLGPIGHRAYPKSPMAINPHPILRKHFDLFANVRPALTVPGIPAIAADTDLVLVRENTEGFYSDRNMFKGYGELRPTEDVALSIGVFTRMGIERVVRFAFELAATRRRHLTVVHKANILKSTSGLFLKVAREVAAQYPEIQCNEMIVDNTCMQLVMRPEQFDVIVTTNLFGDILSDLCAGLVGGLRLAPGANIGLDAAIFEAVHGSAPDIAGKGIANPVALLLGAVQMLEHLGRNAEAVRLRAAIVATMQERDHLTPDLGGTGTTSSFAEAIAKHL